MRPLIETYQPSVFAQFEEAVAHYPEHEFLLIPASACKSYASADISYTYAQAAEAVRQLRHAYAGAGLAVGARVALLLENRPAYFFHWLALNSLGVSVVPLNPDYRQAELGFVLEHSESCMVIGLASRLDDLRAAVQSRALRTAVHDVDTVRGWPEAPLPVLTDSDAIWRSREAALLYTSGTTGTPKGCILSNDYFLRSGVRYMNRRGYVELEMGKSRVLTPLPMFHINAMAGSTMGMIFCGGCVIQLDRFHPSSWWHDVVATRATGVHCLGVMPAILLKLPVSEFERQHQLRYGTAANVEPQHHGAFEERFGFPLVEGWSMTETGAGAAISADAEPRHRGQRCFGKVPATMALRLVGDDGQDVAEGEPGEMWVRAAGDDPRRGFFSGYLKDEAATAQGWEGGWWHTGDIARRGPDGNLFFVDRKKNVIRRSGENISALEVEVAMREHAAVHAVAVTAVPDELRNEEVFAFVQLTPGQEASEALAQELTHWTRTQLAYYKAPGWFCFTEKLPTTATQKVERGQLRKLARDQVSQGGAIDTRALKRKQASA